MLPSRAFQSLEGLVTYLPFHLDDSGRVNEVFSQWRNEGEVEHRRVVDLWTYCFIRRYFLIKFVQDPAYHSADFDVLVDDVFKRAERGRPKLNSDAHYASWVSVICKNVYRNYLKRRRRILSLDDPAQAALSEELSIFPHDASRVYSEMLAAIARLPTAIQQVAKLRLLEGQSYVEIGEFTGKALPTLRSYMNKAVKKLRKDPRLLIFVFSDDGDKSETQL